MIDMHVHYFPPRVFEAIWAFFETRSHGLWTIRNKRHGEGLVSDLKAQGVERFTTLVYAHKPGLADTLNAYVHEACQSDPALVGFGTIYAGDGDVEARALRLFDGYGFHGVKLHPFVSEEKVDDPRLFPLYSVMEARERVLICHPGSAPVYSATDGATRLRRVLDAFPRLRVVVAHCGAFEYGDYHALADDFEHVYFDTAMICVETEVFKHNCPGRTFFERFEDRVVFGSDYPNIPYEYGDQVRALRQLGLEERTLEKMFEGNARRLLGL